MNIIYEVPQLQLDNLTLNMALAPVAGPSCRHLQSVYTHSLNFRIKH